MQNFKEKFKIDELKITEIGNWIVSLRPIQITLSSLVLSLNRKCPKMSEINSEEAADLSLAFECIDSLYQKTLKPDKVNYLALMMVDDQVHFHVIPRYESAVRFESIDYMDKDWPNPPDLKVNIGLSRNQLYRLKELLKNNC